MLYILRKQDFQQIDQLIQITDSMKQLYTHLYQLEIDGKKDTEEYQKIVDYLNMTIEVEANLYNRFDFTYHKAIACVNYVLQEKFPYELETDDENMVKQEDHQLTLRRILEIWLDQIRFDCANDREYLTDSLPSSQKKDLDFFALKIKYGNMVIQSAIQRDMFHAYLHFLQEYIEKEEYQHIKPLLIRAKYHASFINKEIESKMLSHVFTIPDTLYFQSQYIAELVAADLDSYDDFQNQYGMQYAMNQIAKILEKSDMENCDEKKETSVLLRQCFLKSSLLLICEDFQSILYNQFQALIHSKSYLSIYPANKEKEQAIIDCFESTKKDKEKVRIVSFTHK